MSLDFYLEGERSIVECDGHCNKCWEKCGKPRETCETFFNANITHNLARMFDEAGVYEILWRGDGMKAGDVVSLLFDALAVMERDPERFRKHDSPNGWGLYIHAVPWLRKVAEACREYPHATIRCSI